MVNYCQLQMYSCTGDMHVCWVLSKMLAQGMHQMLVSTMNFMHQSFHAWLETVSTRQTMPAQGQTTRQESAGSWRPVN